MHTVRKRERWGAASERGCLPEERTCERGDGAGEGSLGGGEGLKGGRRGGTGKGEITWSLILGHPKESGSSKRTEAAEEF